MVVLYHKRLERRKRQRQIIWLDVETYVKLGELYLAYSDYMAFNDFISNVLKVFISNEDMVEKFRNQFRVEKGFTERVKILGEE